MQPEDLVMDLMATMNKHATSTKAYLQGDHAQHTWGVKMPLVMQWSVGGSNVLALQRYLGLSGVRKSFKSTLANEIGHWFIQQNGTFIYLDIENKTSSDMLDALSRWWIPDYPQNRRLYKTCASIAEWQTMVTRLVDHARKTGNLPKGQRVPVNIWIDSLMGRSTEDADRDLRKEGSAAERGFPVSSMQVTNFLEALNLLGTTCSVGWVQHMKPSMEQTGYGVQYKEKGASAAQFSASIHLRVNKGAAFRVANYDGAPFPNTPTEGHETWIKTELSCVGPDSRSVVVPLCWQYPELEDGSTRQAMWFDWDGALGRLLCAMKYNDDFKPKLFMPDKARLNKAIEFTESKKNCINCEELNLSGESYSAFGRAIQANPGVCERVTRFLGITQFPTVQEADIDFEAGTLREKKKGKK